MIVYIGTLIVFLGCLERHLEHHRKTGAVVIVGGLMVLLCGAR